MVLPITAGVACTFSLGNKVLHKLILTKYNKYTKQLEKDQQLVEFFEKLYRKILKNNIIHKREYESLCNSFTKNVDEKN